ncbi:MAG: UvrD-helicase domain-containing protein [Acidobacteriota bacterium]
MSDQPRFDFEAADPLDARDRAARAAAVDPTRHVALEASAGTGKTRVLVERYVGLLLAGVEPRHILAITFTRKAAAEMRQRIVATLHQRRAEGALTPARWRDIRDQLGEIAISTIDAFCLSLLREFPLEGDVEPGFELADETETPRLVNAALDRALRIGRALAVEEPDVALVFAELGEFRLREGLARLLDRRLVAGEALSRFLRGPLLTAEEAAAAFSRRVKEAFAAVPGGFGTLVATGPRHPRFQRFVRDATALTAATPPRPEALQALVESVAAHVLTREGAPRKRLDYKIADFATRKAYDTHLGAVTALAPYLVAAIEAYRRDINRILVAGVRQLFTIARREYLRTLDKHGVLDFAEVLERALALLRQRDEFSRSRYKLEARYEHVLVDEFQDTSRAQWELVQELIASWAEGAGPGDGRLPPTIFIVGDRKQSIYAFRDAEVAVLESAARFIDALRPGGSARHAITRSFRAVHELLAFSNDVFGAVEQRVDRADAFRYADLDRFPLTGVEAAAQGEPVLGVAAGPTDEWQAEAVADEIARLLLNGAPVRDRVTGVRRPMAPGDIAVLFRTRDSHRVFENALRRRHIPYYVYKGLGFFEADEIKDVLALVGFLADSRSDVRAAAFLRSRFVRLSDEALKRLAPGLALALLADTPPAAAEGLAADDGARLDAARRSVARWLPLVDRLPPAELVDAVLAESAYAAEIGGPSLAQARENLKKIRGIIRRLQNRGYQTLGRIVDHFAELAAGGDESNAIVDAIDAVNLMTVHAAKGLEFPVVFVANLARGSGGTPDAIRVALPPFGAGDEGEASVSVGPYEGPADRDLEARDAEETKRLLYVAFTRARDRLYLTTAVGYDGRFAPVKGSLGKVLPASLAAVLGAAAGAGDGAVLAWQGAGADHALRVIAPAETPRVLAPRVSERVADDFAPLEAVEAVARVAATARAAAHGGESGGVVPRGGGDLTPDARALTGTLVHRAMAAGLDPSAATPSALAALAPDEAGLARSDLGAVAARAAAAYAALAARADVAAALGAGPRVHEVAVSFRAEDGSIVRGVIDCLVREAPDRMLVVEFKTGERAPEHEVQLGLYVRAVEALYPGATVTGRLFYADQGAAEG